MNTRAVLYSPGRNDECTTPDYGVKAIVPYLSDRLVYWCPFDEGQSQFVIQLRAAGLAVVHSHIREGQDFYTYEPPRWDAIVSNPPFTNKAGIFRRALSFGKPFALLMSLTWLNDSAPKRLFRTRPLELLMFPERMRFPGMGSKITFSTAYFCTGILPQQICVGSLKENGMQ